MFVNDVQLDQYCTELSIESELVSSRVSTMQAEVDDYQALLNAAEAARAGLAADEHAYDSAEEEVS